MDKNILLNKVREALLSSTSNIEEKKMFRGTTFMVDGKMCISVNDEGLMCRINPLDHDVVIEKTGCRPMIHGGRTMKGFIFVDYDGYKNKEDFDFWIQQCLEYNPQAKATKKK